MGALTWAEFSSTIGHQFDIVKDDPYSMHISPFKILGNIYYVGDKLASPVLIDTGEGLILIDSGFPETVPMLLDSIWRLGFNPKDIKILLHTHGHQDHYGATDFLKKIYNVKTYLAKEDADLMKEYPESFDWIDGIVRTFEPDEYLEDGQIITLGNTSIRVVKTPGHSPGAVSFFWDVCDNGKTYHVGLPGCIGRNTLFRHEFERLHYPESTPQDFLNSMDKIADEPVTLWLGSHPTKYHNDGLKKYEKMLANPDGPNPFICTPKEWKDYILMMKDSMVGIVENGCI